eukprot:9040819-Alexandrium_andersonii.AAC.1
MDASSNGQYAVLSITMLLGFSAARCRLCSLATVPLLLQHAALALGMRLPRQREWDWTRVA